LQFVFFFKSCFFCYICIFFGTRSIDFYTKHQTPLPTPCQITRPRSRVWISMDIHSLENECCYFWWYLSVVVGWFENRNGRHI
jgi:hypothetical protein